MEEKNYYDVANSVATTGIFAAALYGLAIAVALGAVLGFYSSLLCI
jgi:hypothetical protein